ncbi:DNA-processing protein DprA [Rhodoferax saidenbachensis]|uniref:DNA processing protein n=1 Tax=Rhodoferax saidenbachensis TaxID=1484693 RepID=A0ABU1ZNQ3_9BURK|nr:DNA-processing protein DprA [Rhodoferax saidenbachensis]MDR7307168.1 DNA processing protein [Rhodoferax saidenbachensis]
MEPDELSAWLRLQLSPGVGNGTARKLLAAFGLPQQVFAQSPAVLEACVSARQAAGLLQEPPELAEQLQTTLAWLAAQPAQRRVLTLGDPDYPQALLDMEDPPLLLYAMGAAGQWRGLAQCAATGIAVVGSRNPTPQGRANARQFSQALAEAGLTVVSGLALGVDGAAHEGALDGAADGQLATIAVVGTGLDRVYPKDHFDLAHRIAQRGLLLSEYPLGTPPLSANFPRRNRIIAGLARGTLVVEAALKSGSLITARLAVEQGKDVFAIPGSIHATQARGCHALIKQGAKLVECAQDILEELQLPGGLSGAINSGAARADSTGATPLNGAEDSLLEAMGYDPSGLDALQARTGLDTASLQALLMGLELQGQVARLPGGLFQRMGQA